MKKSLLYLLIVMFAGQTFAQKTSVWKSVSKNETSKLLSVNKHKNTEGEKYYSLNTLALKQSLSRVSNVRTNSAGTIVSIPNLNGELEQ